jgi:hypothetical protein
VQAKCALKSTQDGLVHTSVMPNRTKPTLLDFLARAIFVASSKIMEKGWSNQSIYPHWQMTLFHRLTWIGGAISDRTKKQPDFRVHLPTKVIANVNV